MSLAAQLLAVFVPPACTACGEAIAAAGPPLCGGCLRALPWIGEHRCGRCGLPRHGGSACPAAGASFDSAYAPLAYDGPAREVVGALKFRGALPLTGMMAAQIAVNAPRGLLSDGAEIVPVPKAPARARRRGFDPAAVLARELSRRAGLPVAEVLRRHGPAPRQVGATRRERRGGDRLQVSARGPVPRRVLLLDDVHTTGATLEACARALKLAGAEHVDALTYARTLAAAPPAHSTA